MRSKADTPVKTLLGEGYVSETAEVNGTTLHYVCEAKVQPLF